MEKDKLEYNGENVKKDMPHNEECTQEDSVTPPGEKGDETFKIDLSSPELTPIKFGFRDEESRELMEEIVEDMLHIRKQLRGIERNQANLGKKIELVQQRMYDTGEEYKKGLSRLEKNISGKQKVLSSRHVFNAIVPSLDSLQMMQAGLSKNKKNNHTFRQLNAVISSLVTILQTLGFIEFTVNPGMPFHPSTMECLGYDEGEENTVIKVLRPGYTIENILIRPCGVIIAQEAKQKKGEEQEKR